jgi:hypothetical protein
MDDTITKIHLKNHKETFKKPSKILKTLKKKLEKLLKNPRTKPTKNTKQAYTKPEQTLNLELKERSFSKGVFDKCHRLGVIVFLNRKSFCGYVTYFYF